MFVYNLVVCKTMQRTDWLIEIYLSYICMSWWRHQMETFSALLALCAGSSPVPVTSPHIGQWREALMFSLIWVWINDWVNNREADDLRRQHGHYDVNVMCIVEDLPWQKTFPHPVLIIDKMHHQHSNQKFMNISICESDIKSFMIFLWLHLSSTYTLPLYILRAILFCLWINHEYCETFSFLKNIWIHNYAHFFFKMQTMHGNITICSRLQQIRQET